MAAANQGGGTNSTWKTLFLLGALLAYAAALYYRDLSVPTSVGDGVVGGSAAAEAVDETLKVPHASEFDAEESGGAEPKASDFDESFAEDFDEDFGDDDWESETTTVKTKTRTTETKKGTAKGRGGAHRAPVARPHPTQGKVERSAFNAVHQVHVRFCMA